MLGPCTRRWPVARGPQVGWGVLRASRGREGCTRPASHAALHWLNPCRTVRLVAAGCLQNRKNTPERLELSKYNPFLRRHTVHREIK